MALHPVVTRVCAVLCLAVAVPAAAAQSEPNDAIRWNQALLQAVRNTAFAPMFAARALAVVHTSMYDAWAVYDETAVGTTRAAARRGKATGGQQDKEKAVSFAAYRTLSDLFPSQKAVLFDPLLTQLGYDAADTSAAATVGNEAAAAVLAARHADGSNQLGDHPQGTAGVPYSDYTGYVPVNDPATVVDPNHWQPLLNANGTTQRYLAPHWGLVTPFALTAPDQFRPAPPSLHPDTGYRREARQVLGLSARLRDRQKVIATYWADGPNTETPPGHWNLFAQFVSERDRHGLDEDVKLFFALGNALLDASIAVWDCKRDYDYVRPITAIRFLYAGEQVRAWGGPGQGTQVIDGGQFRPYIGTPPFAEYVSGHSTFSSASAEILASFTGRDRFRAEVTIAVGATPVEPGLVPARPVTLRWPTFSQAAGQAGLSRRIGGIHFESGDLQGRAMGRQIGRAVWEKAQAYFDGTAVR